METQLSFDAVLTKAILFKSWIYTLIFYYLLLMRAYGQIVSGNCYQFMVNNSYLDYNSTTDLQYVYGRATVADIKTSTFKVENAPAPNNSFYTIKTYDGKYLSKEALTNKILLKSSFDDPDNQVFQIKVESNGLFIYIKNSPFGASAMQWKNNEKAYILGTQGSIIARYFSLTCIANNTDGNSGTANPSSWPSAKIGTDNIINPNKGGVIIGTGISSAPSGYKLFVEDGILTEQIVVTPKTSVNWADFVFEKNYQLKSIPTLKSYIRKYKHLPDMPTSNDVVNKGINLGEMAAKHLQKIEELTLYIIQHEEMINYLTSKIKELEKRQNLETSVNN